MHFKNTSQWNNQLRAASQSTYTSEANFYIETATKKPSYEQTATEKRNIKSRLIMIVWLATSFSHFLSFCISYGSLNDFYISTLGLLAIRRLIVGVRTCFAFYRESFCCERCLGLGRTRFIDMESRSFQKLQGEQKRML